MRQIRIHQRSKLTVDLDRLHFVVMHFSYPSLAICFISLMSMGSNYSAATQGFFVGYFEIIQVSRQRKLFDKSC